jgi:hypothetical protein
LVSHVFFHVKDLFRTPIAVTKLAGLFPKPNAFDTAIDTKYDTRVWMTKITGITAKSSSFSAVSFDASFVKTIGGQ